jgi:transcriptional regulator with XRE-family HTH domain
MKHRTPRQIRLDAGFSQEDLASAIGIHQSTISRIERGLMRTSIIRILSIAEALHVSYGECSEAARMALSERSTDA